MHDPITICSRHTDGRGIKKGKELGGGDGGGAAEVSDFFFIKDPNLKKQNIFRVAGEGATRVSE